MQSGTFSNKHCKSLSIDLMVTVSLCLKIANISLLHWLWVGLIITMLWMQEQNVFGIDRIGAFGLEFCWQISKVACTRLCQEKCSLQSESDRCFSSNSVSNAAQRPLSVCKYPSNWDSVFPCNCSVFESTIAGVFTWLWRSILYSTSRSLLRAKNGSNRTKFLSMLSISPGRNGFGTELRGRVSFFFE